MKQEALAFFPHTDLRIFGLMLFFVVFVGVIAWVFRRGSDALYTRMSQLPLAPENDGKGKKSHV